MIEPVTLEEARAFLKLGSDTAQDGYITTAIVAAREWVEEKTGHILVQREITQTFTGFKPWIELRAWPVASIVSVSYLDRAFAAQPLAGDRYVVMSGQRPVRIVSPGCGWPTAVVGAVAVVALAGYAPGQVPELFRLAVLLMVGHFFENRGGEDASKTDDMPARVSKLLSDKRRRRL